VARRDRTASARRGGCPPGHPLGDGPRRDPAASAPRLTALDVDPAALDELSEAADWYEERQIGLGDDFLTEVHKTAAQIQARPASFPWMLDVPAELSIRRALTRRFPYAIVFQQRREGLRIIAVAHAKRRPGYWLWRVTP
jgi:toxin ParE1/3/4